MTKDEALIQMTMRWLEAEARLQRSVPLDAVEKLRAACTLALRIMEQKNKVNVPSHVKTVTVDFAPEDIAVLRAALDPPVDSRRGCASFVPKPRTGANTSKRDGSMTDRIEEIKTKWNIPVTLPMAVPWGKDDVVWLVGEVERLRTEAKCADEEATMMANSDLATTEQVIRALRAEVAAHVARAAIVDDFNRSVASIVKQQPYETAELYDHPSQALKAMCDLIEDLQAENRKGPAKKP